MNGKTKVWHLVSAAVALTFATMTCAQAQAPDPRKSDVKKDAPPKAPGKTTAGKGVGGVFCTKSPCRIKLTVSVDANGNCTGIEGPEYIGVSSDLASVIIQWKVHTAGWTFASGSGIQFKGKNRPLTKKVFRTNATREANTWEEDDNNSEPGPFHYSINLRSGPKKCERDPIIINDMGPDGP